jgi:hypothetical protein
MLIYDTSAEKIRLSIQDLKKKKHVRLKKGGIHYPYPKYLWITPANFKPLLQLVWGEKYPFLPIGPERRS